MKKSVNNIQFNHVNLIGLFSLILMMSFIAPTIVNAQAGKANFAGTWVLNAEKSNLGDGGRRMGGGNFIATQETNLLTVVRTRVNQNGEDMTTTMKYTLDGKESINTSQRGGSKSVAKWLADGKSLSIETSRSFEMNGESRTFKSSEVWSLTNAKTLNVVSTRQGRDGEEVKTTMIYDKK